MKRKQWHVLAYDIADPKRYRACRRRLAEEALFAQRSVCLIHTHKAGLRELLNDLKALLSDSEDDLRIYPIGSLNTLTLFGQNPWQDVLNQQSLLKRIINKVTGNQQHD
jgi:CRISPR-associated endonuclease Cas2